MSQKQNLLWLKYNVSPGEFVPEQSLYRNGMSPSMIQSLNMLKLVLCVPNLDRTSNVTIRHAVRPSNH